jgi:hypothetical protein
VLGWRGSLGRSSILVFRWEPIRKCVLWVAAGQWDKGLSPKCALKQRHNNNAIFTEWKSLELQACDGITNAVIIRE